MVVEIHAWETSQHGAVISMQRFAYRFSVAWTDSSGKEWPARPVRAAVGSACLWNRYP